MTKNLKTRVGISFLSIGCVRREFQLKVRGASSPVAIFHLMSSCAKTVRPNYTKVSEIVICIFFCNTLLQFNQIYTTSDTGVTFSKNSCCCVTYFAHCINTPGIPGSNLVRFHFGFLSGYNLDCCVFVWLHTRSVWLQ